MIHSDSSRKLDVEADIALNSLLANLGDSNISL
jgi:hypothetical protein